MSDDWKAPATCGCGEPATTGLRTCARCRVVRLGARLLPGEDFAALPQDVAPIVERSLLDAVAALERALAAKASSAGHPTVAWPARHGGIVRTFAASPAPDGALAGEAAVAVGCGVILLGLVAGALALALESTRAAGACAASGLLGIWLLVVPYLVGGPR